MKTIQSNPKFWVLPVWNFKARSFRDKAFRTERGARKALAQTNRIRAIERMKPLEIWWVGGKPEKISCEVSPEMTITEGLDALENVRAHCESVAQEYESAMDDPENGVEGWKATDKLSEFIQRACTNEELTKQLILIGGGLV